MGLTENGLQKQISVYDGKSNEIKPGADGMRGDDGPSDKVEPGGKGRVDFMKIDTAGFVEPSTVVVAVSVGGRVGAGFDRVVINADPGAFAKGGAGWAVVIPPSPNDVL